ncbi:MAG: hypothetical protein ACTSW3_04525 [Promethearchaeota archaeon]
MAREIKKIIDRWFKELSFGTIVGISKNEVASWKILDNEQKEELIRRIENWLDNN